MSMTIREQLERREREMLSPKAAMSDAATRRAPLAPCPFRTAYQRDRDRILHSKSFRRLKHKTQVYIMPGDHYRTRLTHSLEVAQISRTIVRALRLNEDLVEAIALGHDVGHTPFGHSGEAVLDRLTGHFAHNEQSLRVVDYLEREGAGLNLTDAVRDGIVHHTGKVRASTLEGRVVHLADRIAYLCHDYDDSVRAGLLRAEDLPAPVAAHIGTEHSRMITAFVADAITESAPLADIAQSPLMRDVLLAFREFMFERIYFSGTLAADRRKAGFVLEQLYHYYLAHFERLPREFINREARFGKEQVVVDYVAGLTDSYAVAQFSGIFVPAVASYR